MTAPLENSGAPPASAMGAVLVKSSGMPEGSQKVEELDFNKFSGREVTVDDLVSGMNHMGFQASSIGEAVRIINDMVTKPWLFYALLGWSNTRTACLARSRILRENDDFPRIHL